VGEARREGQSGERLAVRGRAAVGAERAKRGKAAARLVDGGGGRRVEPAQLAGIGHTPQGAVEEEGGEVGLKDFGRIEAGQAGSRGLLPEAIDGAWGLAAGAAGALGDGGLAGALGDEAGDAGGTVVAGAAGEAAVDDDANAVEGEAGLGDRRGEDDLAAPGRRGGDGAALGAGLEAAVQAVEVDARGKRAFEPLGGALDLGDAGKEGEQAALASARARRMAGAISSSMRFSADRPRWISSSG
jgi:hypothetical protein